MENVKCGSTLRVLEIDTDVLYQWKDIVPTYEERITRIDGIYLNNAYCHSADAIYDLKGDSRLPIQNVEIKNVHVGVVNEFIKNVHFVENITEEHVIYDKLVINTNKK